MIGSHWREFLAHIVYHFTRGDALEEHGIVDDVGTEASRDILLEDFPVDSVGPWPSDLSLRREDMYGDRGR